LRPVRRRIRVEFCEVAYSDRLAGGADGVQSLFNLSPRPLFLGVGMQNGSADANTEGDQSQEAASPDLPESGNLRPRSFFAGHSSQPGSRSLKGLPLDFACRDFKLATPQACYKEKRQNGTSDVPWPA